MSPCFAGELQCWAPRPSGLGYVGEQPKQYVQISEVLGKFDGAIVQLRDFGELENVLNGKFGVVGRATARGKSGITFLQLV